MFQFHIHVQLISAPYCKTNFLRLLFENWGWWWRDFWSNCRPQNRGRVCCSLAAAAAGKNPPGGHSPTTPAEPHSVPSMVEPCAASGTTLEQKTIEVRHLWSSWIGTFIWQAWMKSHMFWICFAFTLIRMSFRWIHGGGGVFGRGSLKRNLGGLNFKQVAMITHRIDGLPEGNFSPWSLSPAGSRGFLTFVRCIS